MTTRTRPIQCCLILLLSSLLASAQIPSSYKEVDDAVKSFTQNARTVEDLKVLQVEFRKKFDTPDKLVRAAFVWIATNISYDYTYSVSTLPKVLARHQSICTGYSELMKDFCDEFGIECELVYGYGMGSKILVNDDTLLRPNHVWNAVKINNEWKLMDVTWASTYMGEGNMAGGDRWFYVPPDEMIKDHFPLKEEWQLLATPMSKPQFSTTFTKVSLTVTFTPNPFTLRVLGDTARFYFSGEGKANRISFTYTKWGINYRPNSKPVTLFDTLKLDKDGGYYYDYKLTSVGTFTFAVSTFNDDGNGTQFRGSDTEKYIYKVVTEKRFRSKKPIDLYSR